MLTPSDFRFSARSYREIPVVDLGLHLGYSQLAGPDSFFEIAAGVKKALVARVYDKVTERLQSLDSLITRSLIPNASEYQALRRHLADTIRLIESLGDLTDADRETLATALSQPGMNTGDGGDPEKPASLSLQGDVGENPTGSGSPS